VAIKIKIPRKLTSTGGARWGRDPLLRFALIAFTVLAATFVIFFSYYYVKYDRIIARRFQGSVFANAAKIYATPRTISVGDKADLKEIASELRHAGYLDTGGKSSM